MTYDDEFFKTAPEQWVLPITPKPERGMFAHWQQQEYVTCLQCGFGFAGHQTSGGTPMWHYKLPTPSGWKYLTLEHVGTKFQALVENHVRNPFRS